MAQLLWKTIWHVLKLKIELPLLRRFSHVRLCVTPWTAIYQAPLSMGFSRQEHWSGLPFPSPELPYDTTIPHVRVCPKLSESRDMNKYLHTHAHSRVHKSWLWLLIRAGFTITKRWKHQSWPNKQNAVCTLNGMLSSLKKTRNSDTYSNMMNLEDSMLSEISQTQKVKCYMIPLIWGT